MVDIMPPEGQENIIANARAVINELKQFDEELLERPRWL